MQVENLLIIHSPMLTLEDNNSYLALGCGVQSSAIAEMIVEGKMDKVNAAFFSDTGNEPSYVYEQRDYLRDRLATVNIELITIKRGDIVDDMRNKFDFHTIPVFTRAHGKKGVGQLRRQCTNRYKSIPGNAFMREDLLANNKAKRYKNGTIHVNKGVSAKLILGISLDESQRMSHNRVKWIKNTYPLIDKRMRRIDCITFSAKQWA